ncbi:GntR family transcriptional regulator [Streptococcus equi]|uniref:GntR family transcriptional regulator n=1 Tax=Streptococcus equi TaxID=1336 RepID=UPI0012B0BD9F|nr:GntR family transcriptional regulator [Streptococcus equi]MCD3394089.1 GntR family transcriptional regulator [Streptococcus equi subsp. zooepidemicus]QGM23991.1 GntR family transcriptional regulator [Streptococcus equi subsp. zooepidemicus]UFR18649.1 GntR family transcriptional regulator [Streptococcus equi subsp. zooepidemicus]
MTELLYKKIYHFIKQQIDSGQLQAGDRLPTEKALSEQFSVSRITSKRALVELEQEGLITRSRGVAVVGFDNSQASQLISPKLTTAAQDFYQMGQQAAQLLVEELTQPDQQAVSCQLPVKVFIRESSQKSLEMP